MGYTSNLYPGYYHIRTRTTNLGYKSFKVESIEVKQGKRTVVNLELVYNQNLVGSFFVRSVTSAECAIAGKIKGYVLDKPTGEALPYAIIQIEDFDVQVHTEQSGNYEIDDLIPGFYNIETRMMGYNSIIAESINVEIGKITIIDFEMVMTIIYVDP